MSQSWRARARRRSARTARLAPALLLALSLAACGDSPTQPTPDTLALTCPASLNVLATSTSGAAVTYQVPTVSGGQAPVTVSCSANSGGVFPLGSTPVTCTARDRSGTLAACAFDVRVTAPPRLLRTRFLAFGDSITAGEVTVPLAGVNGWYPQILLPTAAYPTLLSDRFRQAYPLQTFTMVNAGLPGQPAAASFSRYLDEVSRNQPEVLLLLMGYNDLGTTSTVANAASVLDAIARDARARGARVFIGTLTPTIANRQRSSDQTLLDLMNGRIRTIATSQGAVLVDLYQGFQPAFTTWIGVDGLHPNEAGYVRMAELFFNAVKAELEVQVTATPTTASLAR